MPPPTHIVTMPYFAWRRIIRWSKLAVGLAPVHFGQIASRRPGYRRLQNITCDHEVTPGVIPALHSVGA